MVYNYLHEMLEKRRFADIIEKFRIEPQIVKTLTRESNSFNNDSLPLHIALARKTPDEISLAILHSHEEAVFHADTKLGNLPLHIAAEKNLSADVIESLIRLNPLSLDTRNKGNYTPRDVAHREMVPAARQLLLRPTSCWVHLLQDEIREEKQEKKLRSLNESINKSVVKIQGTVDLCASMTKRLTALEGKLVDLSKKEDSKSKDRYDVSKVNVITDKMSEIELKKKSRVIEMTLSIMEDEDKVVNARKVLSRAASKAYQSDSVNVQLQTIEGLYYLRDGVSSLKTNVLGPASPNKNSK